MAFIEADFAKGLVLVRTNEQELLFIVQMLAIAGGLAFYCVIAPIRTCIIVLVSVCAADIFAYVFGKTFGGKIITARPFPKKSPNKSWEGIIAAIIGSVCAVFLTIYIMDGYSFSKMQSYEYVYLSCGVFAIVGDFLESAFKRSIGAKDSIDFVNKDNKAMLSIESVLGGKNGHGGYLDRFDSIAFTGAVFLLPAFCIFS